jgi:MIP family channel proteins
MISVTAALSEFVAQAIFVFTCTGAATGTASSFNRNTDAPDFQGDDAQAALPVPFVQTVALTFGLTITVLAYATGNKSGAQINGAVTLGLAAAGELAPVQAVVNICAQLLGSMLGSGLLSLVVRKGSDRTGGLGTNAVARGYSPRQAVLGEAIMVFVLMYTVLETACNKKNKANLALAPIAIGFAVYIGHTILIPIDGCSINPTRSFGPAVVATIQDRGGQHFKHFWVFVIGPVTGALVAVAYYKFINQLQDSESEPEAEPKKVEKVEDRSEKV